MKTLLRRLLAIAIVIALAFLGIKLWQENRTAQAYHKLARTVSSVSSVTVYDVSYYKNVSSNELSSALSASFPLEVFIDAAGHAEYHQWGLWKGSPLVILTLRDGSQCRARFSYYGGFFSLEGVPGIYVVNGGQDSEFFRTFRSILEKQFVPKQSKT
jgi:hypothetical protein